jgi:hypothetical protein
MVLRRPTLRVFCCSQYQIGQKETCQNRCYSNNSFPVSFYATNDLKQIEYLREASESVTTSAEVVRYIQDIVVFLRLSRAVAGGVSAKANNQFARFAQ